MQKSVTGTIAEAFSSMVDWWERMRGRRAERCQDVSVHEAQVLAYLKASKLPVGLLMNFGGATLKEGFRRIIL